MTCAWHAPFDNDALNRLCAEAFQHPLADHDWWRQVNRRSLGWVVARHVDELVGFVNVAWDGAEHAIILDTMTAEHHRHRGIGHEMIVVAVFNATEAGCLWRHVDCDQALWPFKAGGGVPPAARENHRACSAPSAPASLPAAAAISGVTWVSAEVTRRYQRPRAV